MAKRGQKEKEQETTPVVEPDPQGAKSTETALSEPPSQPVAEVKIPKDRLTVERASFQKLVYDLVHGYTGMWTGSAGKQRLFALLGVTDREEVERMYQLFSKEYIEGQKR